MAKERITVTVDSDLAAAARETVRASGAGSLSSWIGSAIAEKVRREQRLRAMDEALTDYEAEHGVITEAEMAAQLRADRENAMVVRGRRARGSA